MNENQTTMNQNPSMAQNPGMTQNPSAYEAPYTQQQAVMNQNPNIRQDNVIEIDLMELYIAIKHNIALIITAALLGGILAGSYSYFMIKPTYRSQSSVYVMASDNAIVNFSDFQIGTQLTQDYLTIIKSRPVLEDCLDHMGLDWNYTALRGKLSITNPEDTRVLIIQATDTDPQRAKLIADTVAEVSAQHISDIMEIEPPKVIETGEVNTHKVAPSNTKYATIGAIIGALIVAAIVCLQTILNDSITTVDDVTKYLNLSVLASIPIRPEEVDENGIDKILNSSRKKTKSKKSKAKEDKNKNKYEYKG